MAKIDEVKEWIGFLNRLFTIGLVMLISIIGWLLLNYPKTKIILIVSALLGVFVLVVLLILLSKKIIKNIKLLKDLK
jgi:hypothetical protein